ncbi:MAG: monovalent cation/H(+) antiporter subunit G [Chloroflexi bacterium]|nr:monovalent cation/H(+) antiporter subunit G [Chloroflexota bacterium]MCY3583607.1 monovalent cation/H(+) antiporter subunit G [Chloroflexota bacterium]MCY3715749.1 monovalent cation/H(+) antiporter subunit G [Chloroflexota bacterium]MDE2651268.1 monovalent cation/H(+) antiporter subunit G [Chloroflexota bacterium]MXV92429.1 monovalent cation/H(+) antiporter subunit G [Chloroflexota bacterium]
MLLEMLGVAALVFGVFFCAVGVIGVIRMPDTLSRLHASGKVAILGLFGLLIGAALLVPATALRLLVLGLFVLLTSPVATHAIAAAVHRRREIAQQLDEEHAAGAAEADMPYSVDVTAVLARSQLDEIMEALERTQQRRDPTDTE